MSLQHIQKNSPGLLPKPAKFEKNPPNGYRVIRKTKCGAGGAGSSPIHKQASLAGRLIMCFTAIHISTSDLNRLLSSFHRDHPKSSRNLPNGIFFVVLNELTKAPFEPMKDTDLKHLTLKTAFLLALASGIATAKFMPGLQTKYLI